MTLAELRASKGLTMAQLAAKADVSERTVSRFERGLVTPRPSIYMRLCKALGVKSIDLVVPQQESLKERVLKIRKVVRR